eukprot:1556379-Rhodomonas_salina.4
MEPSGALFPQFQAAHRFPSPTSTSRPRLVPHWQYRSPNQYQGLCFVCIGRYKINTGDYIGCA